MATQNPTLPQDSPTNPPPQADILLDTIRASQETAVQLAEQWVDRVGEIAPDLWTRPVVSGAPAIREITDAAFSLTRGVLDAQYDFTKRIVDSVMDEVKKFP